ncbi:endonuclease exonuclease phosphatase family, partial [Clarias magur]
MVTSHAARSVIAFQPIYERLVVKTHIISVYAPTETSSDQAKDDFYNQLQQTLDSLPWTNVTILAGDFNAHIGTDRTGWEDTMGQFGHEEINDNGTRLLSFASTNNLLVGNSHFQLPLKHQFTWSKSSWQGLGCLRLHLDQLPILIVTQGCVDQIVDRITTLCMPSSNFGCNGPN